MFPTFLLYEEGNPETPNFTSLHSSILYNEDNLVNVEKPPTTQAEPYTEQNFAPFFSSDSRNTLENQPDNTQATLPHNAFKQLY
ncbi:MAG: hypothetical protein RR204_01390 [Raoultibacter sp.]